MTKRTHLWPLTLAPLLAFVAGAAPRTGAEEDDIQLAAAEVFIEFNSTDKDFGIQFFWDGMPWSKMKVEGPDGRTVLKVAASRSVRDQGLTEGFFESAEPPVEELSMEEFLARFPEGGYEFEGRTLDGEEIEGETEFTHVLPAPAGGFSPPDEAMVNAALPLTVSFDAVTEDLDGNPLVPELYEVIIETETDILQVLSVILAGDVAAPSLTVPPEFLQAGLEYKFEVIVQEESGNRVISETTFTTF